MRKKIEQEQLQKSVFMHHGHIIDKMNEDFFLSEKAGKTPSL